MEVVADFSSYGWISLEAGDRARVVQLDSLNFDIDHLRRQMQDTLYIDGRSVGADRRTGRTVMRTHTSPVQSHAMLSRGVPLCVACPGKVCSAPTFDATHTPVFHQVEGLAVDEGLTMAHLKGVLDHFASYVRPRGKTRLRPSYFPFTEPSAEMDLWFPRRKAVRVGSRGGCGMVNPNVLRANGIDPEVYSLRWDGDRAHADVATAFQT